MKTKIYMGQNGHVILECGEPFSDGSRRKREFYCNSWRDAYVWEDMTDSNLPDRQVCDGLETRGETLSCDAEDLLELIRHEYKTWRRNHLSEM